MEPPIRASAMEMSTLMEAGTRRCGIGSETLAVVTQGGDGGQQLAIG
jgi:hypothetical protein